MRTLQAARSRRGKDAMSGAHDCKYSTATEHGLKFKCVPRTKPGERPAIWQELGWAKNWISLSAISGSHLCERCKRYVSAEGKV